jgi:5-hydroxyisourate hydrolase
MLFAVQWARLDRAADPEVRPAPLTIHALDTTAGKPAVGLSVVVAMRENNAWKELASGQTNDAGRIAQLLPSDSRLAAGVYRVTFATGKYFAERGIKTFYPEVPVIFEVTDPNAHHHLPLILSPHGYSTYRGN